MLDRLKQMRTDNRGQAGGRDLPGVMIVLVIAGVVGAVGLQVLSSTYSTADLQSGDEFYNASQDLEQAINNAFGLIGVAFIVVILSVIIFYLYGLRGGR